MKIGIITDSIDESSAGISVYTRNLVENILKLDKKNEYVLIHHKKSDDDLYKKTKQLIIPLKNIPLGREYRKVVQMPKILKKQNFDLIHETAQMGPFFFKNNFKKIVTVHDLAPLKFFKTIQGLAPYLHHRLGLKSVLKNVDKIIAVSESTKNDIINLLKINKNKIHRIYEGNKQIKQSSNQDIFKKYNIKTPYLLFIGTLEPRKNIVNIIKGFSKTNNLQLVIAGKKGWKYKEIFNTVKKLKLQDRVKFIGFAANQDIPNLYKNAVAFIFASVYEGFGLPVLEAMSYGCPVVTSKTSSLPEVAGDAAILVDPFNISEIAEAIETATKDENKRKEMIEKGFKQSKKFSWEKAARETIKLYESV